MTFSKAFHWVNYWVRRLLSFSRMCLALAGISLVVGTSAMPNLLERIQADGKLVVISRNGPTTYYEGAEGITGFEYHLTKAFAKYIGVDLEIREIEDLGQMIDSVGSTGHIAAAGLTVTERRQRQVAFSTPYMNVTQQLLYHTDNEKPKSVEDLIGKRLMVIGNSSHAEKLRQLQKEHPQLSWEERHDVEMLDLMEMVHNQKIDYAILDSNAYELNSALYPKAKVAFEISEPESLAWALPISNDKSLKQAADEFLSQAIADGTLSDLKESVYGHLGEIGYSGALVFARRMESRLPKWRDLLIAASEETNLDWLLLAALSYQESHWNPRAKSPTGVRGFMMLTLTTAKEMGVKNRMKAEQSIHGGARYFRKLLDRMPESVTGKDRIWLALAAYNVGFGHLEDARILTQHHGGNPNKWSDVREFLPLLTKRQYYKYTKHGYARGHEAVTYVQNIRNFYTILAWNETEQERLTNLADAMEDGVNESEFNILISEMVANQNYAAHTPQ